MWTSNSPLPDILGRVFAERPVIPVWEWAERNVYLDAKAAAQPGYYDSTKTPWTRRIQELLLDRDTTQITVKKSSVAGYTEACLNAVRYKVKYDPCNVIFAIDSLTEAGNINEIRLQPTLRALGEHIFTSDDDDVKRFQIVLRQMMIWFLGSYSSGKFANKQAPMLIADEVEEHAKPVGDTDTITNLRSRMKSAEGGKLVLLSKPKLAGGVICKEYDDGNQEHWFIPCPLCGFQQDLVWDQLDFRDCKDLTGEWDKRAVLEQTHYLCINCKQPISERHKHAMNLAGEWRETNPRCTPGHVSQHMSDLYSFHPQARWGQLALACIKAKASGLIARQGFRNHHLGLEWEEQASKTSESDVLKCRRPYRRKTIPFTPALLILGADVGLAYARWAVAAVSRAGEMWIIDWGNELHPDGVLEVTMRAEWQCLEDGKKYQVGFGLIDGKYRKEDVYAACLRSKRRLWPMSGGGGAYSRQSIAYGHVPSYPKWFGLFSFNDRDFKHELYVERIKDQKPTGWHLPENVDGDFILELTKERLVEETDGPTVKQFNWKRFGANHWGDCCKGICIGWRYVERGLDSPSEESAAAPEEPAAEA